MKRGIQSVIEYSGIGETVKLQSLASFRRKFVSVTLFLVPHHPHSTFSIGNGGMTFATTFGYTTRDQLAL
jgi:hypothetical protein